MPAYAEVTDYECGSGTGNEQHCDIAESLGSKAEYSAYVMAMSAQQLLFFAHLEPQRCPPPQLLRNPSLIQTLPLTRAKAQ